MKNKGINLLLNSSKNGGLTYKKILIIGINGFIGCNTAAVATQYGLNVIGADLPHKTSVAKRVRESLGVSKITFYELTSLNSTALGKILSETGPEVVLHLAGVTSRDYSSMNWENCVKGNIVSTASILSAIIEQPSSVRPILIMPGSQMEYGLAPLPWKEDQIALPNNPYGASKLGATELVKAAVRSGHLRGCVTRLSLVFGPAQSTTMFIPELIESALLGKQFRMTEGRQYRRFVFVGDVGEFLLRLSMHIYSNKPIPSLVNMPASKPIRIIDVARKLNRQFNKSLELNEGTFPRRNNEILKAWLDSELADSLNFIKLTHLEKSLATTVKWYRENMWFYSND